MVAIAEAMQLFYARFLPHGLEAPFLILLLYGLYLLISAGILLFALKSAGAKINYLVDIQRGIFTVILRDLIAIPLIVLITILPIGGIIFAFVIWLGILKYLFQISWPQAFLAWLAGSILSLILIVLLIIPLFLML